MAKKQSFIYEGPLLGEKKKNFRMTADSPLSIVQGNDPKKVPQLEKLKVEVQDAIVPLLGNQSLPHKVRILYRVSAPVLADKFKIHLLKILDEGEGNPGMGELPRRIRTGFLEAYWNKGDISITKHHIIPSSRGGVNDPRNYYWLPSDVHAGFHAVFGIFTPVEQMAYLLLLFGNTANPLFSSQLKDLLLSQNQNFFYEREMLEHKKVLY